MAKQNFINKKQMPFFDNASPWSMQAVSGAVYVMPDEVCPALRLLPGNISALPFLLIDMER
ncbi:hypothetical protein RFM41_02950 [Mesorhizobium sp. VK25A]|uniref:Uncharacterized protein n=1 Tax=Mesorhizobium vachelliae TaxID=3072309 RepID=A0ABU5A227_9HYPH|nr:MULTISPECIES: hypothetical protein [unclassified Mesorhizobium]MDX8530697.1 hypothetical protein [Mesorhizobium sp. VK25D]MDX8542674.1 hypothetical protein [Mesorhizobium sp. VK25A]